jgi:hypothetical protein
LCPSAVTLLILTSCPRFPITRNRVLRDKPIAAVRERLLDRVTLRLQFKAVSAGEVAGSRFAGWSASELCGAHRRTDRDAGGARSPRGAGELRRLGNGAKGSPAAPSHTELQGLISPPPAGEGIFPTCRQRGGPRLSSERPVPSALTLTLLRGSRRITAEGTPRIGPGGWLVRFGKHHWAGVLTQYPLGSVLCYWFRVSYGTPRRRRATDGHPMFWSGAMVNCMHVHPVAPQSCPPGSELFPDKEHSAGGTRHGSRSRKNQARQRHPELGRIAHLPQGLRIGRRSRLGPRAASAHLNGGTGTSPASPATVAPARYTGTER